LLKVIAPLDQHGASRGGYGLDIHQGIGEIWPIVNYQGHMIAL
jgi:hypothetical protein